MKEILEKLGGIIELESEEGVGSSFTIKLKNTESALQNPIALTGLMIE